MNKCINLLTTFNFFTFIANKYLNCKKCIKILKNILKK